MLKLPGPASTVEERPPINPAIRVRFPSEADGISFAPWQKKCATPIYRITPSEKARTPSTGTKSGLQFSHCMKKGTYLQKLVL